MCRYVNLNLFDASASNSKENCDEPIKTGLDVPAVVYAGTLLKDERILSPVPHPSNRELGE